MTACALFETRQLDGSATVSFRLGRGRWIDSERAALLGNRRSDHEIRSAFLSRIHNWEFVEWDAALSCGSSASRCRSSSCSGCSVASTEVVFRQNSSSRPAAFLRNSMPVRSFPLQESTRRELERNWRTAAYRRRRRSSDSRVPERR